MHLGIHMEVLHSTQGLAFCTLELKTPSTHPEYHGLLAYLLK